VMQGCNGTSLEVSVNDEDEERVRIRRVLLHLWLIVIEMVAFHEQIAREVRLLYPSGLAAHGHPHQQSRPRGSPMEAM